MKKPWLSSQAREERAGALPEAGGQHGCVYMAEFADDAILGTALELDKHEAVGRRRCSRSCARGSSAGWPTTRSATRWGCATTSRRRPTRSTTTTSTGASGRRGRPDSRVGAEHKLSEYAYASVMDYGARFNSDVHGLGKYDTAAIRFGYGQLIDLIPDAALSTTWTGCATTSSPVRLHEAAAGRSAGVDKIRPASDDRRDAVQRVHRPVDGRVQEAGHQRRPAFDTSSRSGPTSSARTCSRATWTARPGIAAPTSGDRRQRHRAVPELLRLQRLQARAHHLADRRLPEPAASATSTATRRRSSSSSSCRTTLELPTSRPVDLLLASVDSLNAIGAILQTPEPGLHCPTALQPRPVPRRAPSTTHGVIDPSLCLPGKPESCDIGLPDAKPFFINFSDDYLLHGSRASARCSRSCRRCSR